MTKEEITIPSWFLERIEDTLRIQYNINLDKKTGETCQDRNIKECINGVRKLLKGEELTGGERLERLQSSLPSNLDEAADCYKDTVTPEEVDDSEHAYSYETYTEYQIADAFKVGAEWMAGQFVLVGGEPTGWFRANDGSEYATGLDLKEPIKLPVDFYVRKK